MGILERGEQLAALADRLGEIDRGGRLVIISGEAGAGKSALVQEFRTRHLDGYRVLLGRCDDLFAPRPLGPFLDIALDCRGQLPLALKSGEPGAIFEALLAEVESSRPATVLILEDLHWADEATLDLLRFLARRVESLHCLVIATHRDDLRPNHPLRRAWGSLVGPNVSRLQVGPLSLDAIRELSAGTALDPHTLLDRTGGNPFFVTELLAGDTDRPVDAVPATIRDAILGRTAGLSGAARDALDAASVLGRHATTQLIQLAGDCPLEAIDECIAAGLLADDGGMHAFRHDLSRETIEASMTPLRRRQIHRRALEALGEDDDIVQRAHHAIGAGDTDAIADLAARAGDACIALGAHSQAATLYGEALQHAGGLDVDPRLRLLEARWRSCMRVERVADAIAAAEEGLRLAQALGVQQRIGEWERQLADGVRAAGDGRRANELLESAVTRMEPQGDSLALALALNSISGLHLVRGEFDECIAAGRRAHAMADRLDLDEVAVSAIHHYGAALGLVGDPEGIPLMIEAIDRAKAGSYVVDACVASANLAELYMQEPDPERAAAVLEYALAIAEEHEQRLRRNCMLATRADLRMTQGQWDLAARDLGVVLAQPDLAVNNSAYALAILGRIRGLRGDPGAKEVLAEALELAIGLDEAQFIHLIRIALAEIAWFDGDVDTAAAEIAAIVPLAGALSPANHRTLVWWTRRTDVPWTPPDTREPIPAMLEGDVRAVGRFWASHGCPFEAADALGDSENVEDLRQALEQLDALGARPRAKQVTKRLRERGARDIPRGPRPSTRANPAGLTNRELEVAALLASGLSNAEIAERLVLSAKTVDHHVSAVLTKLAVPNRRQVHAAAARLGLSLRDVVSS